MQRAYIQSVRQHPLLLPQFYDLNRGLDLYLMMATVFGTLLLPFLGVLVYFSTAKQWRSPMFLCVFASVVFALAQMVNQMVIEVRLK
jgi:hypothetical protein